jgi:hypothetical protein
MHPNWSPGAVAAAVTRSATPRNCPEAADPNHEPCTGGAGHTSFFGSGTVNALAAASQ